jgi:aspartate aminotransferase
MKIAAKAKEMRAQGEDVVDLSVGEPDFPTPANIKEAAIKAINNNQTGYTINAGTIELRQAIANRIKTDYNLEYGINDIIVSCGAKHSIFNIIQAICYVGDEVIIPAPYWVSYPEMVSVAQGDSKIIQTTQEADFKITPQQLKAAVTPYTKALILCSPSNPTGSVYTKEELEAIAEIILENNIYVISDEIYDKLIYDNLKFTSFPTLSEEIKKKTILVNGVSKAYSMTGWRIGYTAGPTEVIKGINKLQSHSTSNATSISQAAAAEAFNGPQDAVEEMRAEFQKRRDFLHEALNSMTGISANMPQGAFYLFPNVAGLFHKADGDIKIENSYDLSMYLLNESKIATVPGSSFGSEGFIRISYANSMENLKKAADRMVKAVAKLN